MFSFQWPRMPGSCAGGRKGPEWHQRSPLGYGVANRTGSRKDPAGLSYMVAVVAPEAPGPVTVTYVVGIGCPVDFHGKEDATIENSDDSVDCPVDIRFLILDDLWIAFTIV
jgi:hypothetical protein